MRPREAWQTVERSRPPETGERMTRAATVPFIVVEILLLAAAQAYGGWPWTAMAGTAIAILAVADFAPAPLAMVVPGLVWLALFRITGNRELFFPFAIHMASLLALRLGRRGLWQGAVAGGGMVALFLAIRASQQATARVLGLELAVAGLILAVVLATLPVSRGRTAVEGGVIGLATLLALAGLAL